MNFGKLQLNEEVKKKLSFAVDSGTLSHAVLLTGGTSKARNELAALLAQSLLCENGTQKPCLKCNVCKRIKSGIHPDVIVTAGEAGKKKSIKIDAVREIRQKAYILPNESPFQIFIIEEASGMGEEAQNSLLKILEEPPATARFILTSASRDDLRQTILSRVSVFAISEDSGQLAGEKGNVKAMTAAAEILSACISGSEYDIIVSTGALEKDKKSFKASLEKMMLIIRDALMLKYNKNVDIGDEVPKALAKNLSTQKLIKTEKFLSGLIADCDKNANDNLLLTRLSIGLADCIS